MLRRWLAPRVPAAVLDHPKQGFSLRVMKDWDYNAALSEIENGPWVRDGFLAPDWRRAVRPGAPYRNARIWTLTALTRWADHWMS